MPTSLTLAFKRPLPGASRYDSLNFGALGDALEALDAIAWDIGAKPLSYMIEGYATDEDDPWFSAKTGVMAVGALLAYLQNNPDKVENVEDVMDDLRNAKKPLSQAAEDYVPFRFAMT